jgi:transposase-like protein
VRKIPKQGYTKQFKLEAVKLVHSGHRPTTVAKQLGIGEQMELSRRRAENLRLEMEMEILKEGGRAVCEGCRCEASLG